MQVRRAFTLIELMIVVAIVAFLATIGVPQYFKYLARAKQTEVMVNLASLHTAQQAYYAKNGHYTNKLWGDGGDSLGWRPEGYKEGKVNHYYTYGFYFDGAKEGENYFVGKLKTTGEKLGNCHSDAKAFIARAAGDVQGNGLVDIWQVDQDRSIVNIQDGIK